MPNRVIGSDVNKLNSLPDEKLAAEDKAYLEKHAVHEFIGEILTNVIQDQPRDPLQYIIDCATYNPEFAKQDPATGLPLHRKAKLMDVFRAIDKDGTGRISYRMMSQYTNKYGGSSLSSDELRSIFSDFKPGADNLITQDEFIVFFSRVSRTISNQDFEKLISDMLA